MNVEKNDKNRNNKVMKELQKRQEGRKKEWTKKK